jgi:exodeoxyribonuclease VII large subunit
VVTSKAGAERAQALEIEFQDGRVLVGGKPGKRAKGDGGDGQGSLF